MNKFAVVREGAGSYNLAKMHPDFETAKEEAERLCRKVIEIKARCYFPETPIKWEER